MSNSPGQVATSPVGKAPKMLTYLLNIPRKKLPRSEHVGLYNLWLTATLCVSIRELIPGSRNPGHFSNPEIPGLSSPNPGIFGIKLCCRPISALFSPHLAALANPFDC